MANLRKVILNGLHPLLRPIVFWYLRKPRTYRYQNIRMRIVPGVFHPGLFFSTRVLLQFVLDTVSLKGLCVLELGAGSGLISLVAASRGAHVTASEINPIAIEQLRKNALQNQQAITVVESDLFANINPNAFDLILINPPYYPQQPATMEGHAWFCGTDFLFFRNLFRQLTECDYQKEALMILSEDCDVNKIAALARQHQIELKARHTEQVWGERNTIYSFSKI